MKNNGFTFSKWLVIVIMVISLLDMQMPFVLAILGKEQIAETLAITIVTEIIAVFATYSIKAFLETKEEEKNKLEREKEEKNEG